MSNRRGRKQKSKEEDEEWTVQRPKAQQTRSHVCI